MTKKLKLFALGVVLTLGACGGGRHSPAGFRLPENGDVARGQAAFLELSCNKCHMVDGVEMPAPTGDVKVGLGGVVRELRTDGYLVTSIMHPSHRLARLPKAEISVEGESKMPDFAMTMTVRQLIDIVAFLQARYRFEPPPMNYY